MDTLNHAGLWAAHEKQNWTLLWEQAVPVVQATVGRMKKTGEATGVDYDELIAEGNLVAGTAVREWRPLDTTFGSWVSFCVRRKLLNVIGLQRSRDRSRDDMNVELVAAPEMDLTAAASAAQLRAMLNELPGKEQLMIRWFYGIDCEFRSINEIARDTGIHRNSVRLHIESGIDRLRRA